MTEAVHPDAIDSLTEFQVALAALINSAGSHRNIARLTELAPNTVNELAHKKRTPHLHTLQAITKALDPDRVRAWLRALERVTRDEVPVDPGLPHATLSFRGRTAEIAELRGLLVRAGSRSATTIVIEGMAGVGKTAVAVRVADQAARHFPGGVHFLDLGGYTESVEELPAAKALTEVLRKLTGLAPAEGVTQNDLVIAYRQRLAAAATLVILDNAHSDEAVRLLQPGSGRSRIVVTSRRPPATLPNAATLSLDSLPMDDATALLRALVPAERLAGQDEAVLTVARLCGGLPLALTIAGAKLARRKAWTAEYLAQRLADEQRRLQFLQDGDLSVVAAFRLSYEDLGDAESHLFRLLGVLPGPDTEPGRAAALIESSAAEAERLLDQLLDENLLIQRVAGRYRMHDLVRTFARQETRSEQARNTGTSEDSIDWAAAFDRVLGWTVQTAAAERDGLLARNARPEAEATAGRAKTREGGPGGVTDEGGQDPRQAARDWFAAERHNLVATLTEAARLGHTGQVCELAALLVRPLTVGGHYRDAESVAAAWLNAARTPAGSDTDTDTNTKIAVRADAETEAAALRAVAECHRMLGRYEESMTVARDALTRFEELGDIAGQGEAVTTMGNVLWAHGNYPAALKHYRRARRLSAAAGDSAGEAKALSNIGAVRSLAGDQPRALRSYREALAIRRSLPDNVGTAETLNNMGFAHEREGDLVAALAALTEALIVASAVGAPSLRSSVLTNLGNVCRGLGQYRKGEDYLREAARAARMSDEPRKQVEAFNCLGDLYLAAGDRRAAATGFRKALRLAELTADRLEEAHAHDGIGDVLAATGQIAEACDQWRRAAEIYRELVLPEAETVGRKLQAALEQT